MSLHKAEVEARQFRNELRAEPAVRGSRLEGLVELGQLVTIRLLGLLGPTALVCAISVAR